MQSKLTRSRADDLRDAEIANQLAIEGLYSYGLPALVGFVGAALVMRRRAASLTATPFERFIMASFQYYAAMAFGLDAGMKLYEPVFEQKILEKIPNSHYARVIRDSKHEK